ncbi:hypothetical protein [Neobacillus dielmonensis]|uniref:hypothetical protein n=1 Tax=Neobacillus dielmonensis TaxID=1347369 RepID=UPI0005AB3417|nr:hypothetical protein [Neobacillus dielmonensis]
MTSKIDETIVLSEFVTNNVYNVKGLPAKWAVSGMIMSGVIGKRAGDKTWKWFQTEGHLSAKRKKISLIKNQ